MDDFNPMRKEQKQRQRERIGVEIAKVFKGLTKENCIGLLLLFDKTDGSLEVLCSEMNDPKQVQDLALAALTEMRAPQLPDVEGHPKVWTQ